MGKLGDFSARSLDGQDVDLSAYDGQVALVVNTATGCGYATQLPGLQELHDEFRDRGFTVLGFPSDQFKQEPVEDGDMAAVCERSYGVTFPMFATIKVNGGDAHPLFRWLRREKKGALGSKVRWNFTKFLVARDGTVLKRYGTTTSPDKIREDVRRALVGTHRR
jgi:glutathione peroxidase